MMKFIVKHGATVQGLIEGVKDFSYELNGTMEFSSDQLVRIYNANENFDTTLYVFHDDEVIHRDYFIDLNDLEVVL